ncbi:MAG: carbohydrate binding family 9 domain-containing protein [Cyclobacteriaceae bacterium]|nr:carbohydrate binding family 9 domain-containing protein [Cyclobacteriaceae bacterium]
MRLYIFLLLIASVFFASAQTANRDAHKLTVQKATGTIKIDGIMDEQTWADAQGADNFWLNAPSDNAAANNQTIVKLTYDDKNIYIGALMMGPDNYIIQSLKRDGDLESSDAFGVLLDPIGQKSLGYSFGVNVGGAQTEAMVSAAQGQFVNSVDTSWDVRWYSEVSKTDEGWVVEIAIPFKSIRFKKGANQWGINFWRSDRQANERHVWAKVPVQFSPTDLGFTGSLDWDTAPQPTGMNVSITPYALSSVTKDFEKNTATKGDFDFGGEAKVGLSPTLNMDLTVNPDFSQTDVDQQVTNLSRFSIFFPERRQFFLENADVFTNFGAYPDAPFFSRRIGLDARGSKIPISYGARVSGNLDRNWRIGILNAQTRSDSISPSQNYTAAALHRRVLKRSTVRALFVNRQSITDGELNKTDYGRNATMEFEYLSEDGRWVGKASYNHAFKDGVTTDNQFMVGSVGYNGRLFQANYQLQKMGDNFTADMGFVGRLNNYDPVNNVIVPIGYTKSSTNIDYSWYPQNKNIIKHWTGLENYVHWVREGTLNESYTRLRYFLFFRNTSQLRFRLNNQYVNLLFPFQLTEGAPLPVGDYTFTEFNIQLNSDLRRKVNLELFAVSGQYYTGTKTTVRSTLNYRVQPWGNFAMGFEMNDIKLGDPYGSARLWLINPKFEVNFTNNLFWTTFLQYNTQADNFNVNSRIQWRYRPMSDVFLVYTDNYLTEGHFGPKNRAIVLKFNYFFQL